MSNPIVRRVLALALTLCTPAFGAAACPDPNTLAVIGGAELSDLDDLIDRMVSSADGQSVGTVRDVVLDACGTPATLIVALPHKEVAIPIERVRFAPQSEGLRIDGLTQAAIAALPAVDGAVVSLDRRQQGR